MNIEPTINEGLPWHIVENSIQAEQKWLDDLLLKPMDEKEYCKECTLRRIAILIVSGKIHAKLIKSTIDLFEETTEQIIKHHGKDWHASTMNKIYYYFKNQNIDVVLEPNLNRGRADLGVFEEKQKPLFIEVGTISLKKLLFNLETMQDSKILVVIDDKQAVEFTIITAGYLYAL